MLSLSLSLTHKHILPPPFPPGKRKDGATVAAEINAVTTDQLAALASKMLASNVSVAAYGDVAFVPSYPEIAAALK